MNVREITIGSHYVKAYLEGAERCGINKEKLLQESGLQDQALDDPLMRIDFDTYVNLVKKI